MSCARGKRLDRLTPALTLLPETAPPEAPWRRHLLHCHGKVGGGLSAPPAADHPAGDWEWPWAADSTFRSPSFLLRVSEHKPVPASWYPAPPREVCVALWDPDALPTRLLSGPSPSVPPPPPPPPPSWAGKGRWRLESKLRDCCSQREGRAQRACLPT